MLKNKNARLKIETCNPQKGVNMNYIDKNIKTIEENDTVEITIYNRIMNM